MWIGNPSAWSCQNRKYSASIVEGSEIKCDEVTGS